MGAQRGGVYGRIVVTVLAPLAALLLARIPLPGADLERAMGIDAATIGIGAFALRPFMSAALYIEVVALVLPRWRLLRLGGHAERGRLWTRVVLLAAVLTVLQSFFLTRWLASNVRAFAPFAWLSHGDRHTFSWMATQMLSLSAGTFLLYWLARLVDRYGAGNGLAVLIVALLAAEAIPELLVSVSKLPGERILAPLCLAAVAAAGVTRLAGGRALRLNASAAGWDRLPMPAGGLHPIGAAAAMLAIPMQVTSFVDLDLPAALTPGTMANRLIGVALVGALCLLLTWLFNRPRLVEEVWKRAGGWGGDAETVGDRVRAALARALALGLAICWVIAAVEWVCADASVAISVVNLAALACVATDVAGEIRFRHRHGALVPVWPVHRLYVLPAMMKALAEADIPAFARSRRYRTLWNFLAPFAPVDILVPVAHAAAAETIVRVRLGADGQGTPA